MGNITLTIMGNDDVEFLGLFRGLVPTLGGRAQSWVEPAAQHVVEQATAAALVASVPTEAPQEPAAEPAKRTRRTKAEMEAARAAEAAAQQAGADGSSEPLEVVKEVVLPDTATGAEVAEAFANLKSEAAKPLDGEILLPEAKELTEADLRNALMKVSAEDKLGAEKAFGLLQQAGFAKVSDVPAERRGEIIDAAAALLKGV